MKKFLLFPILVVLLAAASSGCQAFLEDYSYSPIGDMSSGGY